MKTKGVKMAKKTKNFACDCGETRKSKFYPSNKSTCIKCLVAKQKLKHTNQSSKEDLAEFNEKCRVNMLNNLRLRREAIYG